MKDMIIREQYLKQIRPFYDDDLIKVITGIRRCGKSTIFVQIISEIRKKTENIVYLNFENKRVLSKIPNSDKLIECRESLKTRTAEILALREK